MKNKITQFIPAILALTVVSFSYFSQWCTSVGQVCYRTVLDQMIPEITYPLYFFAIFFLPIALILAFVPRSIFISWLKFAVWAIPLLILYIMMTPVNSNAFMNLYPFYRDDAARLAGEVFAGISLILIAYKYFSSRRSGKV